MSNVHRFAAFVLALGALVSFSLVAPVAVNAEEQVLAAAPAGPSWDETSGYGSVEAVRAAIGQDTSWDETSGYGAVEASRAAGCEVTLSELGAALAAGRRAESAHLATIPHPGECD